MTGRWPHPGELLPHGASMMLLDEVVHLDDESAECLVRIHSGSRFFEAGRGVPNWVGIEYMAQTIGVHAGFLRRQRGLPVEVGLLLGTRAMDFSCAHYPEGAVLRIAVRLAVRDAEGIGAYECRTTCGDRECGRALIKAFQPDDIRAFLDRIYTESP